MIRNLGRFGVWSHEFKTADHTKVRSLAAHIEDLGFSAIWIPGGADDRVLDAVEIVLAATTRVVVATGILNLWMHEAVDVAATQRRLNETYGDRFLLGLGVSHAELVPGRYASPLAAMSNYLDELDAAGSNADGRVLAALGPRMLKVASDRSAGVHSYNVPASHTRSARTTLVPGQLLAPEQAVVLETDPGRARAIARRRLGDYLGKLPNYERNFLRLGYTENDLLEGGSDRLVDDLFAWGLAGDIRDKVAAHLEAGANHVCIQLLQEGTTQPADWTKLAHVLEI